MDLNKLAEEIHLNNKEKGFYDEPKNVGEMIALMHSELSEALEADRKGMYLSSKMSNHIILALNHLPPEHYKAAYDQTIKGTVEEEMADVVIRVLDFCAYKGIDIAAHIDAKIRYNKLRPHKHGKKY